MTAITTAQTARYTVEVKNGFDEFVDLDMSSVILESSNPSAVTLGEATSVSKGVATFDAFSVGVGQAHITFRVDADISEEVNFAIAEDDIDVSADPRDAERRASFKVDVIDEVRP